MSTELQLRDGTKVQHDSFTGAVSETTVDTTNKDLRVHDGLTPGGHSAAQANKYSDIKSLVNAPLVHGAVYDLISFHPGWAALASPPIGGGPVIYNANKDKSNHDGGMFFAPEAIAAWDGTKPNIGTLLNWTGTGTGVFERPKNFSQLPIENYGAVSENTFDCLPCIYAAWGNQADICTNIADPIYISETLQYPTNNLTFRGVEGRRPFINTSQIRPVDGASPANFANGIVCLNEDLGAANERGQYNKIMNFRVFGNMASYTSAIDPWVDVIGVNAPDTKDWCGMHNMTFRNCGTPFKFTGWLHDLQNIHVYQCYRGPEVRSTGSSIFFNYWLQTCAANWGILEDVTVQNATIQQGNEKQALDDNKGISCFGEVSFKGHIYFEGGSHHIYLEENAVVNVENPVMGFTTIAGGAYGHSNFYCSGGSKLFVRGGRKASVSSFLVDYSTSALPDTIDIRFDVVPTISRIFDDTVGKENPAIPNLYIQRPWGTHERKNWLNKMTFNTIYLPTSSVVLWDQFSADDVAVPFGGTIDIMASGGFTYDKYRVEFADALNSSAQVNIETIFRNTGGDGTNNITVSYASGELSALREKAGQYLAYTVECYGTVEMTNPLI